MTNAIVPEILTDKNYGNWKVWLKSYLLGQGLWDIIDGTYVKPVGNQADLSAWRKNNGKAFHAIQICYGADMLTYIRELDSAKAAWDCLATVHEQASGARKAFLEAELRSCKQGNSIVAEFSRKVKDLCDQMEGIGIKMENDT
ncbi:UBN2_3 domain-containing protein [Cephalotus follicularis]|uniref:UBN2_3 domain-containing protein n=1 Tax=Cephalotus follicularis TaxID=3775 RepID=A0A1Q3CV99_CEPFO|nr:UBN2_3 domain-containing protein [Cephalotus follicularis]